MQDLRTVPDIIEALGGPTAITRALGFRHASTASEWKRQGSIPPRHWRGLIKMADDVGVTISAETLVAAHSVDSVPAAPPADAAGAADTRSRVAAAPAGEPGAR
jgi:hypothetical protein